MIEASAYEIKVIRLPSFLRQSEALLTSDQCQGLLHYLGDQPDAGSVIPDTSGLRTLLWPGARHRRPPAARVFYYFRDLNMPIYLIAAIDGSEEFDLSQLEKAKLRHVVTEIVNEHWEASINPCVDRYLENR